jgi:hypothetical protein
MAEGYAAYRRRAYESGVEFFPSTLPVLNV